MPDAALAERLMAGDTRALARAIRMVEDRDPGIADLLRQVRVAILAYGNVADVGNLCTHCIQTRFDRKRGETAEVLTAIQALLGDGKDHFTVMHDRRGSIGMKHV